MIIGFVQYAKYTYILKKPPHLRKPPRAPEYSQRGQWALEESMVLRVKLGPSVQGLALTKGNALWPVLSGPGAPDTISELISQTDYTISTWKSTSVSRSHQEAPGVCLTCKLHSQEVR